MPIHAQFLRSSSPAPTALVLPLGITESQRFRRNSIEKKGTMLIYSLACVIAGIIQRARAKSTREKARACEDAEERLALEQLAFKQEQYSNAMFSLAAVFVLIGLAFLAS